MCWLGLAHGQQSGVTEIEAQKKYRSRRAREIDVGQSTTLILHCAQRSSTWARMRSWVVRRVVEQIAQCVVAVGVPPA
jgi:hypothetical protein